MGRESGERAPSRATVGAEGLSESWLGTPEGRHQGPAAGARWVMGKVGEGLLKVPET